MISLSVFLLSSVMAVSAKCPNAWGGTHCVDNPANAYFGANPCFDFNGQPSCFFESTSNMARECDCSVSDCNCVVSGDTCDNSVVPTSNDCKADQTTYCPLRNRNNLKDHTMCVYCGVNTDNCGGKICTREITDATEKATLVDKHNELRRRVAKGEEGLGNAGAQPSAADMNELVWDDEVARMAQMWADQCTDGEVKPHDDNKRRNDGSSSGEYCGQNRADSWSSGKTSTKGLADAVQQWYNEVKDFDKAGVAKHGTGAHSDQIGHYTQVVWGATSKIGCGYIYRRDETGRRKGLYHETLVCNYCTGGNIEDRKVYTQGKAASACPTDHPNDNDGLCKM